MAAAIGKRRWGRRLVIWAGKALPDHLRVRVRVVDAEGKELCASRELAEIHATLEVRRRQATASAAKDEPPECEYILQSWDTAFEKTQRADYSAGTTWGVFTNYKDNTKNLILLNTYKKRVEFPDLKKDVLAEYNDYQPDTLIVEKKASGAPLIYELRAMNIPVQEFTPVKGNDKITRLNAVSDLFASGRVWAPNTSWAEEVIDEVASFPSGDHDDYVDTVSLALMRFRRGGYVTSDLDEDDDNVKSFRRKPVYY